MRLYGLIGKTLKHSFSQTYFTKKFSQENIEDCRYQNFELGNIEELLGLISSQPDLRGLNITIPYKEDVIKYLSAKNDIVDNIGACNCIKIAEGQLLGFNTDVIGFKVSLQKVLQPHHKNALILGTGGAAKAVAYALQTLGINYRFVSRKSSENSLVYIDLSNDLLKDHLLIINTTPIGMFPDINEAPMINYNALTPDHLLFDLTYNPEKTLFLQKGEEQGCRIKNGYEMLILQAEESWRIWNTNIEELMGRA